MYLEALAVWSMLLLLLSPVCPHTHSSLDDSSLLSLGVLDSNHRRAILNKSGPGDSIDDDFDNMLGDLSSVIKDLEMFTVVCV